MRRAFKWQFEVMQGGEVVARTLFLSDAMVCAQALATGKPNTKTYVAERGFDGCVVCYGTMTDGSVFKL